MDLKQFDNLAALAADHRRQLESRLKKSRSIRNNLTRMVEQAIKEINERAEKERSDISALFTTLIANEEATIIALREELGEERKILRAEVKQITHEVTIPPDISPVLKLVDKRPRRLKHV